MINFFRKIRQQLLVENKTGKYLKYAIGEIVLVVIGILIALQINTWNEQRKLRNVTKAYIENIINDIVTDTLNINKTASLRTRSIANIDAYFNFFKTHKASLEVYLDSSNVKFELNRYFPTNYTFEEMQSSGNLNLLNKEQKQALMELSQEYKYIQLVAEKLMTVFFDEAKEIDKYFGRPRDGSGDFYEITGMKQDRKMLAQGLLHKHNMLGAIRVYHQSILNLQDTIKQKSRETIKILRFNERKQELEM